MSISTDSSGLDDNPKVSNLGKAPRWASSFHRTQLAMGWWGILLIAGGILHNAFSGAKALGVGGMLLVWVGLTVLGLVGNYLLNNNVISSGMATTWSGLVVLGFISTLVLVYGFNVTGAPVSVVWHTVFALGYLVTGYYMDKRWWALAVWELLVAVLTLVFGVILVETNPPETPKTPTVNDYDDYNVYGLLAIDARVLAVQFLGIDLSKTVGLTLGLTSGIPLLISALPFWKEPYAKN